MRKIRLEMRARKEKRRRINEELRDDEENAEEA